MLLLSKLSANIIVVTLKEKTTLTNPYYLFEFIDDGDNSYTCIVKSWLTSVTVGGASGSNTSGDVNRYDRFTITEQATVSTADRQAGKIHLPKTSFYKYRIYEQASSTNLLPTGTIVERGKAYVTPTALTEYKPTTTTNYITP